MMRFALVLAIAVLSTTAVAEGFRLKALPGSQLILVWQDKAAHDEALDLINAGIHNTNPWLVERLLACTVKPNTRVIVTDAGFVTHDIMVIEGPDAGCRGNIPAEELTTD